MRTIKKWVYLLARLTKNFLASMRRLVKMSLIIVGCSMLLLAF